MPKAETFRWKFAYAHSKMSRRRMLIPIKGFGDLTVKADPSNKKELKARSCYGHLGGTLGSRLFEQMLTLEWLEKDESKSTVYNITPLGKERLAALGVDIYEKR